MNTNVSPSDSDIIAQNASATDDNKQLIKEQNTELLKKYVASHVTQTNDVNDDTTDIDDAKNNDQALASQVGDMIKSQSTIADDESVANQAESIANNSEKEQKAEAHCSCSDPSVLAVGLAKFDELAMIAGVNDIDFGALMKKKRFSLFCKRALDIIGSFIGLALLSPILIFVAILIVCTSRGGVFYRQTRVGKKGKEFKIFKFRTMYKGADKKGLALTTSSDCRITKIGKILRKAKIDELPQLINVLIGQMSFVGYRPEVPKYVALYSAYQMNVLKLRPGITGLASIEYRNQDEVLATAVDVETVYVQDVMQKKLVLNMKYTLKAGFWYDIKLIFLTCLAIFK